MEDCFHLAGFVLLNEIFSKHREFGRVELCPVTQLARSESAVARADFVLWAQPASSITLQDMRHWARSILTTSLLDYSGRKGTAHPQRKARSSQSSQV